jgi:hypothetical protein
MDLTRKWLAVLAAVMATSACSGSSTTPTVTQPTRFTANGEGNGTVNVPDTVMQLQVTAAFTGPAANLAVWIGPLGAACGTTLTTSGCRMLVNQQLGTSTNQLTFSAVVSTGSGGTSASDTLSILSSDGVNWSVDQVS